MCTPMTLQVPVAVHYRTIAPDLAAKYAEVCGCRAPDARTFASALAGALERLAGELGADGDLQLHLRTADGHVEGRVAAAGAADGAVFRCPVAPRADA